MWYYGQKRGGKSGLIPFPRVGRSGANTWNLDEDPASEQRGKLLLREAFQKKNCKFYVIEQISIATYPPYLIIT